MNESVGNSEVGKRQLQSAEDASHPGEEDEQRQTKIAKTRSSTSPAKDINQERRDSSAYDKISLAVGKTAAAASCLVCMESNNPDRPLLDNHQCTQCVKGAWNICTVCNDTLLSRTCPVCRGPYAPIIMYTVPGMPLSKLADKSLSTDDRARLLFKFGVIRNLISKSNMAVWCPQQRMLHFSLPRDFSESVLTGDVSCMGVSLSIAEGREVLSPEGVFTFDNGVWDEIEAEVEGGNSQSGFLLSYKEAVQWLLAFTKHEGSQILAMMSTADWQRLLEPSEDEQGDEDTIEAIKTIKKSILAENEKLESKDDQ